VYMSMHLYIWRHFPSTFNWVRPSIPYRSAHLLI